MADETEIEQQLTDYRCRLSTWQSSPSSASAEALLIARERLHLLRQDRPLANVDELAELDSELLDLSPELAAVLGTRLKILRGITGDAADAWWWKIEPSPSWMQSGLDALTAFALALSLAILVDVFGRVFIGPSDPASLALQSLVGLAGGAAAWQLVKSTMADTRARRRIRVLALPVIGLAAAATLSLAPLSAWYLQRAVRELEGDPSTRPHARPDVALQLAERASRLSPSGLAYYHLAVAHEALGDAPRAIAAYQRAIAEAPNLFPSYNNLARLQIQQSRRPDLAMPLLEAALALQPPPRERSVILKNRAWASLELGHYHAALHDLSEARSASSESGVAAALVCLEAQAWEHLKNSEEAGRSWRHCHEFAIKSTRGIESTWASKARDRIQAVQP